MTDRPTSIDPTLAASLLANWGFLADPDLPHHPGPALLLVAIRATPTLEHYDPESVEYWVSDPRARGTREELTYASRLPRRTEVSWGLVRLRDRFGVSNEYLTFGGDLAAERIDDTVICVFSSPAPLLRRGGHSQGWDTGSTNVGGFFGRLRAAAGYVHEFEREAAAADPVTRYAAFVRELVARYRGSGYLRDRYPRLWTIMLHEEQRLEREHPVAWQDGLRLLERADVAASGNDGRAAGSEPAG